MLTVRNHGNEPAIVGDKYLFPGQSNRYHDHVARAAVANNPGALSIVDEVAEVVDVEAQPVEVKPVKHSRKAKV